jgi:type II secretory pathway pseudopilin PulG
MGRDDSLSRPHRSPCISDALPRLGQSDCTARIADVGLDHNDNDKEDETMTTSDVSGRTAPVNSNAPGAPAASSGVPPRLPPPRKNNTALWVGLGCLFAFIAVMIVVAVIGLLAAIAIPAFAKARSTAQMSACMNNLRLLESAKDQAAIDNSHKDGETIPESEFSPFLKNGLGGLVCPNGGAYAVNPVGKDAQCSVHGTLTSPMHSNGRPARPPQSQRY